MPTANTQAYLFTTKLLLHFLFNCQYDPQIGQIQADYGLLLAHEALN